MNIHNRFGYGDVRRAKMQVSGTTPAIPGEDKLFGYPMTDPLSLKFTPQPLQFRNLGSMEQLEVTEPEGNSATGYCMEKCLTEDNFPKHDLSDMKLRIEKLERDNRRLKLQVSTIQNEKKVNQAERAMHKQMKLAVEGIENLKICLNSIDALLKLSRKNKVEESWSKETCENGQVRKRKTNGTGAEPENFCGSLA